MDNFPKQWPGNQNDPLGPRYAEWSRQMPSFADTPLQSGLRPFYKPANLGGPERNVSAFTVEDFALIPQLIYERNKHDFSLDELGRRFASAANAFAIHRELSKAIFKLYNVWIPRQEDQLLAEVMSNAYRSFFNINMRTGDLERDLYNLNVMVVEATLPVMKGAIELTLKQLVMIDRVPTPNPLPINVNNRGLDGRSCFDLGRYLPFAEYFAPYEPRRTPYIPMRDSTDLYLESLRGQTVAEIAGGAWAPWAGSAQQTGALAAPGAPFPQPPSAWQGSYVAAPRELPGGFGNVGRRPPYMGPGSPPDASFAPGASLAQARAPEAWPSGAAPLEFAGGLGNAGRRAVY